MFFFNRVSFSYLKEKKYNNITSSLSQHKMINANEII